MYYLIEIEHHTDGITYRVSSTCPKRKNHHLISTHSNKYKAVLKMANLLDSDQDICFIENATFDGAEINRLLSKWEKENA
jgi:hypothetical protein